MLWLIILGILLILGIICSYIGTRLDDDNETLIGIGGGFAILISIFLIILGSVAIFKNVNYNVEMREYQLIKEQVENCSTETIKAIGIYDKIMELNKQIIYAQEYKNSPWRGIFIGKSYCEMEIIEIKE